ncbi:hypothetical protein ACFE04_004135 [Oxalis oulophora]
MMMMLKLKPSQLTLFKSLLKPFTLIPINSLSPIPTQHQLGLPYYNSPQAPTFQNPNHHAHFSTNPEIDQNRVIDTINAKFAEAREEIEMAMESKETVYFDEEAECARIAVKEVLDMFDGLLSKLSEGERASLQRSMGLKMEQLKAELDQLNHD